MTGSEIDFNAWLASCYDMLIVEDRYSRLDGNFICVAFFSGNEDIDKYMHLLIHRLGLDDNQSEEAFNDLKSEEEGLGVFMSGGITPVDAVENVTKQIKSYYDKEIKGGE